jgi:hypothetical protein
MKCYIKSGDVEEIVDIEEKNRKEAYVIALQRAIKKNKLPPVLDHWFFCDERGFRIDGEAQWKTKTSNVLKKAGFNTQ